MLGWAMGSNNDALSIGSTMDFTRFHVVIKGFFFFWPFPKAYSRVKQSWVQYAVLYNF